MACPPRLTLGPPTNSTLVTPARALANRSPRRRLGFFVCRRSWLFSAVAAANFFHFTEHSVIIVKQYLKSLGEPVRLDSHATYRSFRFNDAGRTGKRDDGVLEALRFHYVPEERI